MFYTHAEFTYVSTSKNTLQVQHNYSFTTSGFKSVVFHMKTGELFKLVSGTISPSILSIKSSQITSHVPVSWKHAVVQPLRKHNSTVSLIKAAENTTDQY